MARRGTAARISRILVSTGIAALIISFGLASSAQATGTSTKVEQGWELLSQAISNQAISTTIAINRGSLSSGNFNPSPSPVFEVTGKVTGGTGGSWTVALLDASSQTIASTSFYKGTDANFNLHSVSFGFTGAEAASLSLTSSGTNPGVLSINKAYIRFKQNGVVKATDAHVSMATAQSGITSSTYATVFNPTVYKHVTGDYSPAPTIKLRVTGVAGPRTKLYVQLTTEAGMPVSNSEVIFSNSSATDPSPPTSVETAALTLANNTKYVVAAKVLDVASESGNGPQADGPSLSPTGDLLSADLELRQSTTDSRGLEKSVSWTGSVSSAVTVPPTGDLNFKFEAPVIQAPCATPTWQTVVSGTSMAANMQDTTSASSLTNATTYTGTGYSLQPVSASVPTEGHILDTNIATGGAGTITWSALRYALCLWDTVNPTITNFRVSQTPFNPYAGSTTLLATLADDFALDTWTIAINRHSDGLNVRNLTGTAANLSAPWDGKNGSGAYVAGGLYDATLTVLDTTGNSATSAIGVTVAFPPVISNYLASDLYFSPGVSPGVRDDTTFSAALSGDAPPFNWTLTIKNAGGQTKKTYTGNGTPVSQTWNGQDSAGAYVADGMYTATLSVTDAIGSVTTTTLSTSVTVDRSAPVIYSFPTMYLSGTGNGNHSTSISPSLSDSSWPLTYNATIRDSGNNVVRTLSGASISWDGRNGGGVLQPDGSYGVALSVTDAQNLTATTNSSIVIDSVSPAITSPAVSEPYFSPNGDGVKDTTTITATISDSNLSHWLVKPRVTCPNGCSSSSGSSSNLSFVWNGRVGMWNGSTYVPTLQPDGSYVITSSVYDLAGNSTAQDIITTTIDTMLPSVTVAPVASNAAFSPNGDGMKDDTELTATGSDANPLSWVVKIKDASSNVLRTMSGTGATISAVWDGTGASSVAPDGLYGASAIFTDGAGNALTANLANGIRIDTVAPHIVRLFPEDMSNTAMLGPRLGVNLGDVGSAVDSSSIQITFDNVTYQGASLSQQAGNWIVTAPVTLSPGQNYAAGVLARDLAGNVMNSNWSFRAITITAGTATAALDGDGVDLGPSSTPGLETWSFKPLVSESQAILSLQQGSLHPGWGMTLTNVPLTAARLKVKVNGVESDWPQQLPLPSSVPVYQQFGYLSTTTQGQDVRSASAAYPLVSFTLDLPVAVTSPRIHMDDVVVSPQIDGICPGPGPAANCSPDPLPFFMSAALADRVVAPTAGVPTLPADADYVFSVVRLLPDPFLQNPGGVWWQVNPLALTCPIQDNSCVIGGVAYPSDSPIVPSIYRDVFCDAVVFCRYTSTQTATGPQWGWCLNYDTGADLPAECDPGYGCFGAGSERCQQTNVLRYAQTETRPGSVHPNDIYHKFVADYWSDYGYAEGSRDNLGLLWSTPDHFLQWKVMPCSEYPAGETCRDGQTNGIDGSMDGQVYPIHAVGLQNQIETDASAYDVWLECFAVPGKGYVRSQMNTLSDSTGRRYGVRTGTSSNDGWRQRQNIPFCTDSNGVYHQAAKPVYIRATHAELYAWVAQTTFKGGSTHRDGAFVGTYGHKKYNVPFSWWWLVSQAGTVACGAATEGNPWCDTAGFIIDRADSNPCSSEHPCSEDTETTRTLMKNKFWYK